MNVYFIYSFFGLSHVGKFGQFISWVAVKNTVCRFVLRKTPLNYITGSTHMTNLVEYQYRILNINAVIELTALSRSTIYELINPKSKYYDVSFPKPIRLTEVRVGWVSQEIYDWLESKIAQRSEVH